MHAGLDLRHALHPLPEAPRRLGHRIPRLLVDDGGRAQREEPDDGAHLEPGARSVGKPQEVVVEPIFFVPEAVRPDVQAVTLAMDMLGFMGPVARPLRAAAAADLAAGLDPSAALARGAELGRELELRDSRGIPVAVDWIELMDFGSPSDITAWVGVRRAPDVVLARNAPHQQSGGEASRPEA